MWFKNSFTFSDAQERIISMIPDASKIKECLNKAVSAGLLSYDRNSCEYTVLELNPQKKNGAGINIPNSEQIAVYESSFLNASNIGMTDSYLKSPVTVVTNDEILNKALLNSLKAAVFDTSLAHKSTQFISKIVNDKKLLETLTKNIEKFDGSNYRKWHTDLCNNLIDDFNSSYQSLKNNWTFGNSQKVVNLVVKYLCVVSKRCESLNIRKSFVNDFGKKFLDKYSELDIPVDRYILRSSWNWNHHKNHHNQFDLPSKGTHRNTQYYRDGLIKNWSSWDYNQYTIYQESLHRVIEKPLDWEGYAWTEGKKEEKNNAAVSNRLLNCLFQ